MLRNEIMVEKYEDGSLSNNKLIEKGWKYLVKTKEGTFLSSNTPRQILDYFALVGAKIYEIRETELKQVLNFSQKLLYC